MFFEIIYPTDAVTEQIDAQAMVTSLSGGPPSAGSLLAGVGAMRSRLSGVLLKPKAR